MSFQDLPDDWPEHPITDPAIFIDVVDLMATVADREAGAIYVLVCYPSGHLAQPCVITELDEQAFGNKAALFEPFTRLTDTLDAVSYTHLDVYKRQVFHSLPSRSMAVHTGQRVGPGFPSGPTRCVYAWRRARSLTPGPDSFSCGSAPTAGVQLQPLVLPQPSQT